MERICGEALKIFKAGVKAVLPENLIFKTLRLTESSQLILQEKSYSVNNNVYIVGFGKAVLGMAVAVEKILGKHIVSGIVSAPIGITKQMEHDEKLCLKHNSCIKIMEGAHNNLPDENSLEAATSISNLVSSLKESDLLIVLISGGGSALLPSPPPGMSLNEKLQIIKLLTAKGANVQELNTIRKRLSTLKGGGLANIAKPAQVISLILSDIIGDPLDLISSAPTVLNTDNHDLPLKILEKYNLLGQIPNHVKSILQNPPSTPTNFGHVMNIIIGSNKEAASVAFETAQSFGYIVLKLTLELQGIAKNVGKTLASLACGVASNNLQEIKQASLDLNLSEKIQVALFEVLQKAKQEKKGLCFLCAGETVVQIQGTGIGGRNQELALAAAIELHKRKDIPGIVLLSAGTDGIDGPTTAAGAIATCEVVEAGEKCGLNASEYLRNNDSFNFYKSLNNGKWHVVTGHSGTNVMDLVVILVKSLK